MKYEIEWLTDEQPVANECGVYTKPNAIVHLFGTKEANNKSFLRLRICEFAGEGYRYAWSYNVREKDNFFGGSAPIMGTNLLFQTIEECIIDFVNNIADFVEMPTHWHKELNNEFLCSNTDKPTKNKQLTLW